MITQNDFEKKQIIFAFCHEGERLSLINENIVIKDEDGKVKIQCSCYRLFLVFIVGNCSLTTPLLRAANKFGFNFAFMTTGFHLYSFYGSNKEGNTLLKTKQYQYNGLSIAKRLIKNKVYNQKFVIQRKREKTDEEKADIKLLQQYIEMIDVADTNYEVMAYEGNASRIYFQNVFSGMGWKGRQPRIKRDYINATLDIGYTILFSFIDAILCAFGFDCYKGFLHTQFYMRKSLVCDFVEPFRPIIDLSVQKGIHLKQIKREDFFEDKKQWQLEWKRSPYYARLFVEAIIEYKREIFAYIQTFYRSFMKEDVDNFPMFLMEDL